MSMQNDEERPSFAVVIPAYNEAESVGGLITEIIERYPAVRIIVVNDGSVDETTMVARMNGAEVLELPCNLGVGGAVQAGFRYAWEVGERCVIRLDGDGQHPPSEIPKLLAVMEEQNADLVVGSRFLRTKGFRGGTCFRRIGNRLLASYLSVICRSRITDPTSGFWCVRGDLLRYFSIRFPSEYPEPEAMALLRRQGYWMAEADVTVVPRRYGRSSIGSIDTLYFALRVMLALVCDRVRPVDRRFANVQNRSIKRGKSE